MATLGGARSVKGVASCPSSFRFRPPAGRCSRDRRYDRPPGRQARPARLGHRLGLAAASAHRRQAHRLWLDGPAGDLAVALASRGRTFRPSSRPDGAAVWLDVAPGPRPQPGALVADELAVELDLAGARHGPARRNLPAGALAPGGASR